MARPIWKGHISFGLVNVPVVLYSAERRADLSFRLIDSRNSARVRYERVNEETGEEVPWDRIVKGFEYDDGNYVLLSPGCKIGHDAAIGDFCSFMYSVHLAGNTTIAEGVYIGTQATVLQQLSVGTGSIIGAGDVVTKSLPAAVTAVGLPAHIIKTHASPLL